MDWEKLAEGWSHQMPLPDFELQDHTGRKFRLGEMSEGHVFVGLIFTHCSVATACPKTTQKMLDVGMAWRALRDGGGTKGRALRLLTLTFDPEEDTPEVLARYSSSMRGELPDWIFATGPSELMAKRLPAMLGVMAVPPRAGREISHNVKAVLLGPGLRVLRSWSNNAFEVNEVLDEVVGR